MRGSPVPTQLDETMERVFGAPSDTIQQIAARARREFAGTPVVVWEGDPNTFRFSYVSSEAEAMLGHPCASWVEGATFWVDHIVHPEDRADAVAYCALATGKGRHHMFEYRAVRADGTVAWLRDVVCVVLGARRVATTLRGIMFDVTAEKALEAERPSGAKSPTYEELAASA